MSAFGGHFWESAALIGFLIYIALPLVILEASREEDTAPTRVLVVVNGQLRGGLLAWRSLTKYVLKPYAADLALLGPPETEEAKRASYLRKRAKYLWEVVERDDWGEVLDSLSQDHKLRFGWRALCLSRQVEPPPQFLGGVKPCHHNGSAAILLAYRYLALQKLEELELISVYDWFIYTRSDYVYLCPPLPLRLFPKDAIYVPTGQGYGGYTDRHALIPSSLVRLALNITSDFVLHWQYWYDLVDTHLKTQPSQQVNLEVLDDVGQILVEFHVSTTLGMNSPELVLLLATTVNWLSERGFLLFHKSLNKGFPQDQQAHPDLLLSGFPPRICCVELCFVSRRAVHRARTR
ncbi:hypothetical protein CYMTET_37956 [Cymbomonas tetramitiformis]|uniref:Uncharacterized protein n=1 Tax=Cymbomonas tetramitiformis TaxID=36881 RepID=A0AAE0CF34_9CHLO|nr:hypothetical protein CYMTET_37956 [Cymbomonas tetramitiformis]